VHVETMRAAIAKVEGELGVGMPENARSRPSPKPRPRVNIIKVRLAAAMMESTVYIFLKEQMLSLCGRMHQYHTPRYHLLIVV
jgi:hypothetical protein